MKKLLAEVHRRNVFRMAVLYLVSGWALLSTADLVFSLFDAPDGSLRVIFYILVGAFPFALFLSWFFEITPVGLRRESEVTSDESITADTGRRMNFLIAGSAILIFMGMAIQYFVFSDDPRWIDFLRRIDELKK